MSGKDEQYVSTKENGIMCECGGTLFEYHNYGTVVNKIDIESRRIYDDEWIDTGISGWICVECGSLAIGDVLDLIRLIEAGG